MGLDKQKIIEQYAIYGVAKPQIKELMKELNLDEKDFYEYMFGQTCGLVGDIQVYYVHDILMFANGLKCID